MQRWMFGLVVSMFVTACGARDAADAGAEAGPPSVVTPEGGTTDVVETCVAPNTRCSQFCTDLMVDSVHCGTCTTMCRSLETCRMGICTGNTP